MATTASLKAKVETAISDLLDAMDDDTFVEYQIGNRRYRRAEFQGLLTELFDIRDRLNRQLARANSNPVRVVKLGRPRTSDR